MDPQTYRSFLENFVSNNKGTTLSEVNLISVICPLSVLLLALLNSKLFFCETAINPQIHIDEEDDEITFRSQSFTSLMEDLRQDINRVSSLSRCLNGTFP